MKKYMHAWLSLKAIEVLDRNQQLVSKTRAERLKRLLDYITTYPDTFVRGAWFPDTVIQDNVQGGHTWKYYLDDKDGRAAANRPPLHNQCLQVVKDDLNKKVSLDKKISDLPDRCEALSQTIRDMIKITNSVQKGDVVAFNNSQIALMFLMLSHYIADAHMPLHCDQRDFYTPSTLHPDIEDFWEKEILKDYSINKALEQFDLDENMKLQLKPTSRSSYKSPMVQQCDALLAQTPWADMASEGTDWFTLLGKGNLNVWDYMVSVCLVSFHMSLKIIPLTPPDGVNYKTLKILKEKDNIVLENVIKYSPAIIVDAINSIALVWLATWERWELLREGKRFEPEE